MERPELSGYSSVVERLPSKQNVVSSSLTTRSMWKEMSLRVKFRESAWEGWECFIEGKLPISFGFGSTQIDALKMAVDNFPRKGL